MNAQCISSLPLAAMIIAVNTRFLLENHLEGLGYYTSELLKALTAAHPEHEFHFLFDRPFAEEFIFASNVHGHVLKPAARHPVLWKFWFDLKIPALLKKIKADVFISPDGYCSLATSVPQVMVVHDLAFLHYPGAYKKTHYLYYKHYLPQFLRRANRIAAVSEFTKNDIIKNYRITAEKIDVVYNAVKSSFRPIGWDGKDRVKQKYTDGKEYFLYTGAIHPRKNLINLLKGFSMFKKRVQTTMKLVLAGRLAWKNEEFLQLLKTFKYREDVILTGYLPEGELVELTAAAYALVYPSLFEGFGVPVLEALACEVAPLTSRGTAMEEIAGNAALYFDPNDVTDIGNKLLLIYRDEDLKQKLVENSKEILPKYSWKHSADALWQCIEKAAISSVKKS
jgi:glycosyltransferase involved in cell wall biosynthesis